MDGGPDVRHQRPRPGRHHARGHGPGRRHGRGVFRRFPDYAASVEHIYFDRAMRELMGHDYSGVAEGSTPSIRLHVGFVSVGAFLEMLRARTGDDARRGPRRRRRRKDPGRGAALHGAGRHRGPRALAPDRERLRGPALPGLHGLPAPAGGGPRGGTLEHARPGGGGGGPPQWRAAHDRLVDQVSAYAGTNTHEASAEMFKLWWCGGPSVSPLVGFFGRLVDEFLPGPA